MRETIINDFPEIEELKSISNHDAIVRKIQEIMKRILLTTKIEIDNKVSIEPVCIEAYYYKDKVFEDNSVHRNDLQKNHFGKLYIHRKGRGGIDLCLSEGNYYLSFLIREAYVTINEDNSKVLVDGHVCLVKYLSGLEFGKNKSKTSCIVIDNKNYKTIEDKNVLFTIGRNEDLPVYFSTRINIPYNRESKEKYSEEKAKEKYVFALLRAVKGM